MNQPDIPISSAEDFRRLAMERRRAGAVPLRLPSGLMVEAVRPAPEWWLRRTGRLPEGLAAQAMSANGGSTEPMTTERLVEFARWTVELLQEVVVRPVVRAHPGPDEVDPAWISDEDFRYILRFAGGEIEADGSGLDRFSGGPGRDAGAVPRGEDVERAT